jgi:transketolase
MRNRFAQKLTQMSEHNDKIMLLSGDIGNRLFDNFKAQRPDRFFNCGVAEQNMTGMAAGLAKQGFLPVTYTIAPFCTTRCLEQIRVDVAYHNLPVTIVSVGAGLSYAGLGPTHHSFEDTALLRVIPNMRVLSPADSDELSACLEMAFATPKPTYIRMGKKGEPDVHGRTLNAYEISTPIKLTDGEDVCLIGSGTLLPEVVKAAELLSEKGVSSSVYSLPQIKPLPAIELLNIFSEYPVVAVFEEHSLAGGLSSACAELLVDHQIAGTKLLRFGIPDTFYKKSGSQSFARDYLGLTASHFVQKIINTLSGHKNENTRSHSSADKKAT